MSVMEFFVIGIYKTKATITGFRLLSFDAKTGNSEIKDINYGAVFNAVRDNKIKINNLAISKGWLTGVNGAMTRYGVIGSTRALVILKEIVDNNSKTLGYICADTSGEIRNLKIEEIIQFAEKHGIANGRIVTNEKGLKFLATIEGKYNTVNAKDIGFKETEKSNENDSNGITGNENSTGVNKLENMSLLDKALIMDRELTKSGEGYKLTFAYKIALSVKQRKQCSIKQYNIILKQFSLLNPEAAKYFEVEPVDFFEKYKQLINKAKQIKQFKGSYDEQVSKTVERTKKCSERQYDVIQQYIEKWGKEENEKAEQAKAEPVKTEDVKKAEPVEPEPVDKKSEPVDKKSEPVDKKSEPVEEKPQLVEEKPVEPVAVEPQQEYDMTDPNNFEYITVGDTGAKKLYIKGLKEGVEVSTLVLPETLKVNGRNIPIKGIYTGAFAGNSSLVYVETGRFIEDIGQRAFQNCEYLEEVNLSKSKHKFLARELFSRCGKLKVVNVGECIERIHEGAFFACSSLKQVELPKSLKDIAREAFYRCTNLKSVLGGAELNIQESAFCKCINLQDFDFSNVQYIGTAAFKATGFVDLKIGGNIKSLGRRAFSDCIRLKEVWLEEGVVAIGDYCFSKSQSQYAGSYVNTENKYTDIELIHTPKSLTKFGDNVFSGAKLVEGYTGSGAESHCRGYQIEFRAIDSVDRLNSSNARIKSQMFDSSTNIMEILHNKLNENAEGASNPNFEMRTAGLKGELVDIALSDTHIESLGIGKAERNFEPHIKFKAAVNYLLDINQMYTEPFHSGVLRLQKTFYIKSEAIYDDDCNKIYKISYIVMDTLEKGDFIAVVMFNHLRYCVDCNLKTNLIISETLETGRQLPFKQYLHAGDALGTVGAICGRETTYTDATGKRIYVGEEVFNAMSNNSIQIDITQEKRVYYVPAVGMAFRIVDKRKWDKSGATSKFTFNRSNLGTLKKGFINHVIIQDIWDYDTFINEMNEADTKVSNENKRFFKDIMELSDSEVNKRLRNIGIVEEEKQAQLYKVSKMLNERAEREGVRFENITPELVTLEIFNGLAESYWMIEKDQKWFSSIGAKSLNTTNQYIIDKCKLIEYKSNQVVKFNNPYMSGMKGAYIYKLEHNGQMIGAYASRFNFETIIKMLAELTHIRNSNIEIPVLMQNANEIDKVDKSLFFDFYNVLDCTDGWELAKYIPNSCARHYMARFTVSMYKPTGIFYLVMQSYIRREVSTKVDGVWQKNEVRTQYVCMPILPIGNMDRALVVANTTNTGGKGSQALKELIGLCAFEIFKDRKDNYTDTLTAPTNYYKVRQMVIDGETDAEKYKKLIDDRVVYMLGTVHKGALRTEGDNLRALDDDDELYNELFGDDE